MSKLIVKRVVRRLPYHKNKLISNKLKGITAAQVKCVFNGSITNPEIVKPVLKAAEKLAKETILISRKKMKAKKRA